MEHTVAEVGLTLLAVLGGAGAVALVSYVLMTVSAF